MLVANYIQSKVYERSHCVKYCVSVNISWKRYVTRQDVSVIRLRPYMFDEHCALYRTKHPVRRTYATV